MATPPHLAVGTYELQTPFTVVAGATYICESIEGFEALNAEGVDIYAVYYAPHGLSTSDYLRDLRNNENIITLLSNTEAPIRVPSSYILSFPTTKSVPYSRTFVTFDLGALPNDMDLSDTVTAIKELLDANIGINSTGKVMTGLIADSVSFSRHADLEVARQANVNYRDTYARQLKLALEREQVLVERNNLLTEQLKKYVT